MVLNSFSLPIFGFAFVFTMLRCLLHDIAGAIGLSNFLLAFLRISECSVSCSMNTSVNRCPAHCAILGGQRLKNGVSRGACVHAFKLLSRSHMCLIVFKTENYVHASRVASQVLRFHEYTRA